ncbi:hypothetical protein [Taibaiella chishuiensis]|uniref:Uncharacterized protein n=1 Tax=Taibaiella chishuiensis TaxID=1434707 RepID=A0A2P8D4E9_9BACT|nr:hypothetical protein [Taibaiella chishuiensis]PSK92091.1 hypothetical protein B0I18_104189 [Taibaiella chishuiensis]
MKSQFLVSVLFLSGGLASGQSFRAAVLNPNVYRTEVNFDAVRLSDQHGNIYNEEVTVDVEGRFMDYKIISEDENGYIIIRVLPRVIYETINTPHGLKNRIRRAARGEEINCRTDDGYYYNLAVKKENFPPLGKTLLSTKIVGVPLVHPFKLRAALGDQDWELQPEFSVSYSFGIRLRRGGKFTPKYLTLIPYGFGLGNAKYFRAKDDPKEDGVAITYYQAGLLYTWNKVNFGAFIGFDAMISKRNDWFYQGNSWYSFGLGYKFNND